MATTVLSGTSGALYYKPAGTTGGFGEAGVNVGTDTITIEPYLNLKAGDPVVFSVVNSEIDVTTIGSTPGQYAPFRNFISGFADGSGTATVYMTNEDAALSNRMVEDVLQRQQTGAAFKLYTDQVFVGGTLNEAQSRSIAFDAVLTSASLNINPDDAQSVTVNFRPSATPVFDFAKS
jgi:hypothetical protein